MVLGDNLPLLFPKSYIIFLPGSFYKKGAQNANPNKKKRWKPDR